MRSTVQRKSVLLHGTAKLCFKFQSCPQTDGGTRQAISLQRVGIACYAERCTRLL